MIPSLRQAFNARYTPEKFAAFQKLMEERSGMAIPFPLCETPCFFPQSLLDELSQAGKELIHQLGTLEYRKASFQAIPPEFNVPRESPHPLFVQVDFGLVQDATGKLRPKLVELQGFPSLYAYQATLSQAYIDAFGLDSRLKYLLSGLNADSYKKLLHRAIVGDHDPENVVLMEIEPRYQKTAPDFVLTEKMLGVPTVDIAGIKKVGSYLFYERKGKRIPIHRIYNRAIVDELIRKKVKLAFNFTDELEVEWAGHPNWYFRMSKFSLPYLKHGSVPKTWFLDRVEHIPDDLENYVVKPLFSFAGLGVIINPRKEDLAEIPKDQRSQYILQERIHFTPVIETPHGATKAEIRMMYIWLDEPMPVMTIIRMGRGMMMGVDHNKNMAWVGSSAGLYLEGC